MTLAVAAIIGGLIILVWSADRFVEGAASTARHFGMTPLLIGIVVIGFGTSAPEMLVSASSALSGSPGIALGNAYGSNITNIALILGLTAIIKPLSVNSDVLKKSCRFYWLSPCFLLIWFMMQTSLNLMRLFYLLCFCIYGVDNYYRNEK